MSGDWAVVSGASSGLGLAIARELGAAGLQLALLGRREPLLRAALAALGGGTAGRVYPCDVRDGQAVEAVASDLADRDVVPAVVVAAAGRARIAPLVEESAEEFADVVATNLHGTFHLFRAFAPGMVRRGTGALVAMVSSAGRRGFAGWSTYCASKWGVDGLAAALREELAGTGVRLLTAYPGATDTPIWDQLPGTWDRGRMMRPEDVARVVVAALLAPAPSAVVEEIHLRPPAGTL